MYKTNITTETLQRYDTIVKDNPEEGDSRATLENHLAKEIPKRKASTLADPSKPVLVRIPPDLLTLLREEALRKGNSVNSVIVTVLKKYSDWWRFQERLGFVPLHKSMVIQMLEEISDEDAEKIGQTQKDQTIKDFIFFSEFGYDLKTFIWWIKLRSEVLGFQFVIRQENDSMFMLINHGMSSKWSHYYKGMFEAVLQELLEPQYYKDIRFNLTDSSFSVTIMGLINTQQTIIGKK